MMKVPPYRRIYFRANKSFTNAGKKLHLISYKGLRKLIRCEVKKFLKQDNSKNANAKGNLLDTYLKEQSLDKKSQLDYDDIREIIINEIENVMEQCFPLKEKRSMSREDYFHAKQIEQLKSVISSKNALCDNYVQNLHQSVLSISAELNTVTERLDSIECFINKDQSDTDDGMDNIMTEWQSDSDESNITLTTNVTPYVNDDKKSLPDILKIETSTPKKPHHNSPHDYEIYFARNKTCDYDFFKNLNPTICANPENLTIKDKDETKSTYNTSSNIVAKEDKERNVNRTHRKPNSNEKLQIKEETRCPQCCLIRSSNQKSSKENLHYNTT